MKDRVDWKKIYAVNFRLGLGRIIKGIDYSRIIEYPLAFSQLELGKRDLILDVGSSDSVFPILLSDIGHQVYAIDIDKRILKLVNYVNKFAASNLMLQVQDVTRLPYADDFFDKITAISTLEHVLPTKDGDVRAMREVARTLKIGGQAIVTVPYDKEFESKWSRSRVSRHLSLMRKYDKKSIYERLVKPSGLHLVKWTFFGESIRFSKIWYTSPFCIFAFPSPFFAKSFMDFGVDSRRSQGVCLNFRKYNKEKPRRQLITGSFPKRL
jgi:SAM-dependent methyltransferase